MYVMDALLLSAFLGLATVSILFGARPGRMIWHLTRLYIVMM